MGSGRKSNCVNEDEDSNLSMETASGDALDDESSAISVVYSDREPSSSPTTRAPARAIGSDGSTSDLSSLHSTLRLPNDDLTFIDGHQGVLVHYGSFCTCPGWCTCQKYKYFTSSTYSGYRKAGLGDENAEGGEVPSQIHLSEAVLAAQVAVESSMRSTIRKTVDSERMRMVEEIEREAELGAEATFTWEEAPRPAEAPRSWVGDDWEAGKAERLPVTGLGLGAVAAGDAVVKLEPDEDGIATSGSGA